MYLNVCPPIETKSGVVEYEEKRIATIFIFRRHRKTGSLTFAASSAVTIASATRDRCYDLKKHFRRKFLPKIGAFDSKQSQTLK
jgi:hypothetical protein